MTIYMLMVSNEAKMVQSCVMPELCQRAPFGLAFANGVKVCVATAQHCQAEPDRCCQYWKYTTHRAGKESQALICSTRP